MNVIQNPNTHQIEKHYQLGMNHPPHKAQQI
jgi:hypothetical protein